VRPKDHSNKLSLSFNFKKWKLSKYQAHAEGRIDDDGKVVRK